MFPDDGEVLSGGNFHGQPLSLPLDYLALALCELARVQRAARDRPLSPSYAELPPFLTPRPGLSSGLMIAQYAAAALVNECQVLAHPAGAGSIPTSAGQEDFNSMGALGGAQGAHRGRERRARDRHGAGVRLPGAASSTARCASTPVLEEAVARVRERVPRLEEDRSTGIGSWTALATALRTGELVLA